MSNASAGRRPSRQEPVTVTSDAGGSVWLLVLGARELCSREHELGSCGSVVVQATVDGTFQGHQTAAQPSSPYVYWNEVLEIPSGAKLSLSLVDMDPLQPRRGRPRFCFGEITVSLATDASFKPQPTEEPLEKSPSGQGLLKFQLSRSRINPATTAHLAPKPPPAKPSGNLDAASGFVGVLSMSVSPVLGTILQGSVLEAEVGAVAYTSWDGAVRGPRRMLISEHDPNLRLHATLPADGVHNHPPHASGHVRLSRVEGPRGHVDLKNCSNPHPVLLKWELPRLDPWPVHLRFFPADYLLPGRPSVGVRVCFELKVVSSSFNPALRFRVPSQCIGRAAKSAAKDIEFIIRVPGSRFEVCMPEPQQLVENSTWQISHLNPDVDPDAEALIDILALRLRRDAARTVSIPLGGRIYIFTVTLARLLPNTPVPVEGVMCPGLGDLHSHAVNDMPLDVEGMNLEDISWPGSCMGEVAGVLVHMLSIRSPAVTSCAISVGAHKPMLIKALPHQSRRIFLPVSPGPASRITLHVYLPQKHLVAETYIPINSWENVLGHQFIELQFRMPNSATPLKGMAMISLLRWPAADTPAPVTCLTLRPLIAQVQRHLYDCMSPTHISIGQGPEGTFRWSPATSSLDESTCGVLALDTVDPQFGMLEIHASASPDCILQFMFIDVLDPEAVARGSPTIVSLPLVIDDQEKGASFLFIPLELTWTPDPFSNLAFDDPAPLPQPSTMDGGFLLLHSLSACLNVSPDIHDKTCHGRNSAESIWAATSTLSLRLGTEMVSSASPVTSSQAGILFSWRPAYRTRNFCVNWLPHLLKINFFKLIGVVLDMRVESRLCCKACGARTTVVMRLESPWQPEHWRPWQPRDVRLHASGPGVQDGSIAYAQLSLITSTFIHSPQGLLSISVVPLEQSSVGISEALKYAYNKLSEVEVGSKQGDSSIASTLRLSIEDGSGFVCGRTFEGTAEDDNLPLHVESKPEHRGASLTVVLRGALIGVEHKESIAIALLGPLGDRNTPLVHPLWFSPSVGLALKIEYTPHGVIRPSSEETAEPSPEPQTAISQVPMAKAKSVASAQETAQVAEDIRMLQAAAEDLVRRAQTAAAKPTRKTTRPRSAGVIRSAGSKSSHPYIDRKEHLWLNPMPIGAPGKYWCQEMDRQVPRFRQQQEDGPAFQMPKGWEPEIEKEQGLKYRFEFLDERQSVVENLKRELRENQVEARKMMERLARAKRCMSEAEKRLRPPKERVDSKKVHYHEAMVAFKRRQKKAARPIAREEPPPTAQVRVRTACCGKSVEGALIHCGGRREGMTDANGVAKLALPPGKHVLTIPGYSDQEVTTFIEHDSSKIQDVDFRIDGKLFFFLQDMSFEEDETRIAIKLCANQSNIPNDAMPYQGSASVSGVSASAGQAQTGSSMSFSSLLSIGKDTTCGKALLTLQVQPSASSGLKYDANPDAQEWFDTFKNDCVVHLLFTGTPLPLGYLSGKKIDKGPAAKPEGKAAVAKATVSVGAPVIAIAPELKDQGILVGTKGIVVQDTCDGILKVAWTSQAQQKERKEKQKEKKTTDDGCTSVSKKWVRMVLPDVCTRCRRGIGWNDPDLFNLFSNLEKSDSFSKLEVSFIPPNTYELTGFKPTATYRNDPYVRLCESIPSEVSMSNNPEQEFSCLQKVHANVVASMREYVLLIHQRGRLKCAIEKNTADCDSLLAANSALEDDMGVDGDAGDHGSQRKHQNLMELLVHLRTHLHSVEHSKKMEKEQLTHLEADKEAVLEKQKKASDRLTMAEKKNNELLTELGHVVNEIQSLIDDMPLRSVD